MLSAALGNSSLFETPARQFIYFIERGETYVKKTLYRMAVASFTLLAVAALSVTPIAAQDPAKVAGTWEMTWEGRQGPVTSTVKFEQTGDKIKGTITGMGGRENPFTGTVSGKTIKFTATIETPNGTREVPYEGTVDGDTMKGTVQMGPNSREWTAKKK